MVFGNNKGNYAVEGVVVIVLLIAFALIVITGNWIFDQVNTGIQTDEDISQQSKDVSGSFMSKYANLFDNLFIFIMVMLFLGIVVGAFFMDEHPIFFVVSLIIFIIALVGIMSLANAYDDVVSSSDLSTSANNFPFIYWVTHHILEISIAVIFGSIIITYIKLKS